MRDYTPDKDGIDHINIYSKGRTLLGRLLSNFAHTPFEHPQYGSFASVEGYWYWLSTGMCHDDLRYLHGIDAKRIGTSYPRVYCNSFIDKAITGIEAKMNKHVTIDKMLKESKLPLAHYYVVGSGNKSRIFVPRNMEWFIKWFEDRRKSV